jgi:hypothetical protein
MGPRPHNSGFPIALRVCPVCYLCGGQWRRFDRTKSRWRPGSEEKRWKVNVQCERCLLLSAAIVDQAVMHSREWIRCRR